MMIFGTDPLISSIKTPMINKETCKISETRKVSEAESV
jgi:hypothetical protein